MKSLAVALSYFLLSSSFAQTPDKYIFGDGYDQWGVKLTSSKSELNLRIGARLQSLTSISTSENEQTNSSLTEQDFQARRVRLNVEASFRDFTYYMDLRNDRANSKDSGENEFNIGDAYVYKPILKTKNSLHAIKLFRAKVDVSRSQTASSSELTFVNRPMISDFASHFISEGRRASNVQLVGTIYDQLTYQLVIGDGVYSGEFNDAKGNDIKQIERQNFMVGGKARFFPFQGWVDLKPTETYLGEGKHFSVGAGFFNTSNIFVENESSLNASVSRNLTNLEASGHYKEWFIQAEYFIFDGVIENHNVTTKYNIGKSEGWYVQGEKLFSDFYWLAPFARYEIWDRFMSSGDYLSIGKLFGINWYANGNRFKVSLAYEINKNAVDIGEPDRFEAYHLATAWNF